MHPIARSLLFTSLFSLITSDIATAQGEPVASDASSALLQTSALPDPSSSAEPFLERNWIRRGPEDRVGAEVGVIGLVRQKPSAQILAFDRSFNVLLDADELQGEMQFGLSTKIDVYQVSNAWGGLDLQLGYWGINSMDATRTLVADQVRTIFFQRTTAAVLTTMNYNYSSNLYSGEANLRMRNTARVRPLVGMRYLKLEDTFDHFNFANGGVIGFFSLTNNSLYGAQVGLEATVLRYRSWDWFGICKYSAMHNRVEGSAEAAVGSSPVVKNYGESSFCSLIDGETGLTFHFVDGLQFKASYQALYASDIATGSDQSRAIDILDTPDQAVFDSRFWQGVGLSAIFSF